MIHVFILGYSGADYFSHWHPQVSYGDDIKFYFVDNGQQHLTKVIQDMLIYQTTKNIFCAGGWNLICDIAFNDLKLDKIIIGQEDAIFTDEILREIDKQTNQAIMCGTYDRSFEFSLFGLHSETYKRVGRFDENFILGGNEDNDYKHRCKLCNVNVTSLNISADYNRSLTSEERAKFNYTNSMYLHDKWGQLIYDANKIYEYDTPYNSKLKQDHIPLTSNYRNYFNLPNTHNIYMSNIEYNLYKLKNKLT